MKEGGREVKAPKRELREHRLQVHPCQNGINDFICVDHIATTGRRTATKRRKFVHRRGERTDDKFAGRAENGIPTGIFESSLKPAISHATRDRDVQRTHAYVQCTRRNRRK